MTLVLGWFLVALPFLMLAVITFAMGGWQATVFIFGTTGIVVAVMYFGIGLINGDFQ